MNNNEFMFNYIKFIVVKYDASNLLYFIINGKLILDFGITICPNVGTIQQ